MAKVALPATATEARILIPRTAILKTPIGMAAFTATSNGEGSHRAELRMISIGPSAGDSVSVLEGLSRGDQVIIDGQFALSDGDPIVLDAVASQ